MPSLTLLGQSLLSGLFIGGLYGLFGLGLSLSWGLLRLINLAHFALIFLGAYLTYQLTATAGLDPFLALLVIVPAFFVLGVALQATFARLGVGEFASLLVTFGLTVVIESVIQAVWTADFRRLESPYGTATLRAGPLFLPVTEVLILAAAIALSLATWAWLRYTYVGKALRAGAEDPAMAAAFGSGHYSISEIAAHFGVPELRVDRAVEVHRSGERA